MTTRTWKRSRRRRCRHRCFRATTGVLHMDALAAVRGRECMVDGGAVFCRGESARRRATLAGRVAGAADRIALVLVLVLVPVRRRRWRRRRRRRRLVLVRLVLLVVVMASAAVVDRLSSSKKTVLPFMARHDVGLWLIH